MSDRTTGTTAAASASEREAESHWRVVQEVRRTFDFGNGKALCPEWCQEAFDEARQAAQKAYYCQSFHCSKSETEAAESDAKAKLEAYAECVWKHCPPGSNQNIATGDAGGAIKPAGETVLTTPGFASPWRGNAGGRNFDFAGINPLRFSSGGFIPSDQWNQFSPPSASTASAQVGTPYQIIVITFIFDQFSPLWPTGQPALGSERREPSRGHPTFWAALGSLWDWLQPRRPASFRTEVGASMLTAFLPQAPPVRNEAPARPEVRIDHQEVGCAVAEQYPRLEACFSPGTRVGRAQVRFRSQGTEDWYYVDMNPDGQCLSGILPKPKPTLKEFEYYIAAIDRDFSEKRHPDSAPEGSHSVRIVTREGDCEKGTRMARALLRKVPSVVVGALRGTRSLVPGGFSPEGVVAAPPPLTVSVVATGASMGEVFQLQVVNHSSGPVTLAALDGLVLEPIQHAPGTLIATPGSVATRPVHGYCVEFAKPPPPAGTLYRVADASVQQKFRATRTILRAGRKLALQGKLHPDSDPQSYLESIKQYAVWARMEGWDEKRFGEQFLGRTKKNVEAAGRAWTKEMDAAIRGVTPGRWRDISLVLEAAGSVK